MNINHLNFLHIQQQANSTFRSDDVRQLLFDVAVLERYEQWTDDNNLKLCCLTALNQIAVELIIIDFDVKKTVLFFVDKWRLITKLVQFVNASSA